jgi:hypothetical protein
VHKFAVVLGAPGTGKTAAMATAAAPLTEIVQLSVTHETASRAAFWYVRTARRFF